MPAVLNAGTGSRPRHQMLYLRLKQDFKHFSSLHRVFEAK